MNTDISHIPDHKREDLERVVKIIQATTYKNIGAEMILLYGSYARGDFVVRDVVSEGGSTRVYESDLDIFIITKKPTQEKNMRLAHEIERKIHADPDIDSHFSIIIEDIHHVNRMLEESRYFYVDIKREAILLYDSGKYSLASGRELPLERKKQIQQEDFNLWFLDADTFFTHYQFAYSNGDYRIGAFLLHQAAERYITAFMLVQTGYKAKTHDLEILYTKMKEVEESFVDIFDLGDTKEKHHFELLRKAYIEARYSKEYHISADELEFLAGKLKQLRDQVEQLCLQEIQS